MTQTTEDLGKEEGTLEKKVLGSVTIKDVLLKVGVPMLGGAALIIGENLYEKLPEEKQYTMKSALRKAVAAAAGIALEQVAVYAASDEVKKSIGQYTK